MSFGFRLSRLGLQIAAWAAAVLLILGGAGVTILMSQTNCSNSAFQYSVNTSFSVNPASIPTGGGQFGISWFKAIATPNCPSEAVVNNLSGVSWLSPQSVQSTGSSGSGTFIASANSTTASRSTTITFGSVSLYNFSTSSFADGTSLTVTQAGTPVTSLTIVSGNQQTAAVNTTFSAALVVQVNSNSGPVPGVQVSFSSAGPVSLSSSAATTNANGQASVTATAGAAAGNATVTAASGGFSVTFNLTVSTGCSYSLSPSSATVGAGTSTGNQFSVTAGSGCAWSASTTSSFLQIASGASGTGNGSVTYSVTSANTSSIAREGSINVTGTTGFIVTQSGAAVPGTSAISSGPPASTCAAPTPQKYYSQGATIYPWISFSFSSPSDVVTAQVNTGLFVTLTRPSGGNCNYGPISGLSPGSYTVSFNLNGAQVAQRPVVIVSNQVTLSTVGTRAALPGNNQINIQAAIPAALPDAAAVTLTPSFTPAGVANAAAGSGAYDCRFLQGSGSLTVSANATQSSQAPVSAGTVAGTCNFSAGGVDIGSAGFADFLFTPVSSSVALSNTTSAPYIAGVTETGSGSPFTLVVTGYSMTRDLSTIVFTFSTTQSGYTISSGPLTANVQSPAVTWYTSAGSAATGGQFQYTQQFNITGGTSANLSQVTVTATSPTSGTSQPVTIQLQ